MDHLSSYQHSDTGELEKFDLQAAEFSADQTAPLPERYGDNRLVAMARDPRCVFVYWEFTQDTSDRVRREGGASVWEESDFILRVFVEGGSYFDVDVPRYARQWYVLLEHGGGACYLELGLRRRDGVFFSLLRSNRVQLPAGRVSEVIDTHFAAVHVSGDMSPEDARALMDRDAQRVGRGSAEFSRSMAQRWEFLRSVFSGSPWGGVSSASLPSSGQSGKRP